MLNGEAGCEKMNPNVLGMDDRTPLMEAATQGHTECVRSLLAAGAEVGATDTHRSSALHYACEEGNVRLFPCFSVIFVFPI